MGKPQNKACNYCSSISNFENQYPIREGIFSVENKVLRCAWHSQFQCSQCKKFHHFSWLFWCPNIERLICGDCNPPELIPMAFWNTTYAYRFVCKVCGNSHYDLYYSEFLGVHPWQKEREGLYTIRCVLHQLSKGEAWHPKEPRKGEEISLEDALRIPNRVLPVRKKIGTVRFHSELINEDQMRQSEVHQQWEQTSKEWLNIIDQTSPDDKGDINRQLIIDSAMWDLIGDVKNLRVLDAGCGNGYFSRMLAREGAIVTGVDHSESFIEYCQQKEKDQNLGITYYVSSLDKLPMFKDQSFDLIVSNVVFIDVLSYKEAFIELTRVLKLSGRLIWSNLHPIFARITNVMYRMPYDTVRNEERIGMLIDRYFDTGGTLISWGNMKPIWQFDRTLSEYSSALKQAGLVIQEIIEPKPDISLIKSHPRHLAFDADRIPYFIIYECIRYH